MWGQGLAPDRRATVTSGACYFFFVASLLRGVLIRDMCSLLLPSMWVGARWSASGGAAGGAVAGAHVQSPNHLIESENV